MTHSTLYNVSNKLGLDSIEEATASIVSTMKAFNVEASDTMSIADKFNEIGEQNCRNYMVTYD